MTEDRFIALFNIVGLLSIGYIVFFSDTVAGYLIREAAIAYFEMIRINFGPPQF